MNMNCSRIRFPLSIICIILLLLSCLDIRVLAEASYAADSSYISDVVFWDAPNARAEREYGFDPANHGTYEVYIGDNARAVRMKVSATDFQEDNVYCQMTIGDTASDPVKLISGEVSEIVAPVSSELTGSAFRLGARKEGNLVVGQYDPETGEWGSEKTGYSFSFVRRVVLNSVSMQDQDGNRLTMDPAAIDPNTDEYSISIPETSETIKFTPTLTIKSTVRDEEDPDGTLYKKTISYDVPDGALISQGDAAVFEVSKLDIEDGRPYITANVNYSKENSDIITSSYRFYLDGYEVIPEEDHTPDAVIMESDKEITCDKDEDVELRISAQVSGEANLSYQWFEGSSEGSVTTRIEGAGNSSYHPETKYARTKYYRCCVTNTVNEKKYIKYSGVFKVTVRCSYVTPPEIYELTEDQEIMAGSSVFFDINTYFYDWDGDSWHEPEYEWYINEKADTEGAELLELKLFARFPGSHGSYQFDDPGIYYVYCIATATIGDKTGSTTSDYIKITVKEPEGLDVFEGTGTEESPYLISSLEDIDKIRTVLKTGYYFKDKYFKLTSDLTLPPDWEPVGALKEGAVDEGLGVNIQPFSGFLDGFEHTVTVADGGKPLFGYVREASIKNLNIYGSEINGYGLIDNYVVDYGTDGNSDTGVPATCDIENVTVLSGTSILKSGFIGGYASGQNTVNITNCVVEKGVTIGYDKSQSEIGSFAGSVSGTITNCRSSADVYGNNDVGGLVGKKGQSMGEFNIQNSEFTGSINATGDRVGGIAGSGYYSSNHSAPNAPVVVINNCYTACDITGKDQVGGILGAEPEVETAWGNGTGGVQNSFYYGKITATGSNVGGIIGYYNSLDKFQTIANNFFLDTCGVSRGIGKLNKIIIAAEDSQFGREDDFDADRACSAASAGDFADGTVLEKLNSGEGSYGNWVQGTKYPEFKKVAVPTALEIEGYKIQYYIGDDFDTSGMRIIVNYSDKTSREVEPSEVEFSGFDSKTIGQKKIIASYGPLTTEFKVSVLYEDPGEIIVKFILLGDDIHGDQEKIHTLAGGGLTEWINNNYVVDLNMTVKDVFLMALAEKGLDHKGADYSQYDSYYISGIQVPGTEEYLSEFTNGVNSGWMYTVNGYHSDVGVDRTYLEDGDEIIVHYTDDHTKEKKQMEGNYPFDTGHSESDEEEAERKARDEAERKAREAAELAAKVKAVRIAKAKAARTTIKVNALKKHKAKITWKKVTLSYTVNGKKYTSGITGYKVYRAAKKTGKYKLIKTVKKAKTLKYTDRKLKKGKKYFYKVRTYTKIDGKIYLGKWSAAKKIRAK